MIVSHPAREPRVGVSKHGIRRSQDLTGTTCGEICVPYLSNRALQSSVPGNGWMGKRLTIQVGGHNRDSDKLKSNKKEKETGV
jgi:hypothetical protein